MASKSCQATSCRRAGRPTAALAGRSGGRGGGDTKPVSRRGPTWARSRPELREEPDEHADDVDEAVLQRERAPTNIAHPETRGRLTPRQLPERLIEIAASARRVHLGEPTLELIQRQPPAVVVPAQLIRRHGALGIRGQGVEAIGHATA